MISMKTFHRAKAKDGAKESVHNTSSQRLGKLHSTGNQPLLPFTQVFFVKEYLPERTCSRSQTLAQGRILALQAYRHRLLWINMLSFTTLFKAHNLHQEGVGRSDQKNTERIQEDSQWASQEQTLLWSQRKSLSDKRVLSAFTILQTDWVSVFPLLLLHLLLLQYLSYIIIKCIHLHFTSALGKLKFTDTNKGHYMLWNNTSTSVPSSLALFRSLRIKKCPHTTSKSQTLPQRSRQEKKSFCGNLSSPAHHKIVQQKPDFQVHSWPQHQRNKSHSFDYQTSQNQ